jgi:type III pantothenate kinase
VLGVFDGARLRQSWRLQTVRERTSDELGLLSTACSRTAGFERVKIRGVILGSVVPPLTGTVRQMVERYFGVTAVIVEPGVNTGMPILYKNPGLRSRRSHRHAVARTRSSARRPPCRPPMIVVDFGTATTLDAISAKGRIPRRRDLSRRPDSPRTRLFQRAARLPRIDVRKPAVVVGQTTVGAMESGLFWVYVGMVEGLVRR